MSGSALTPSTYYHSFPFLKPYLTSHSHPPPSHLHLPLTSSSTPSTPSTSHSPPKGSISIDYPERVKRRVHHLMCGEEILNHGHTQVGQQQTQKYRGCLADIVTYGGGVKERERGQGGRKEGGGGEERERYYMCW